MVFRYLYVSICLLPFLAIGQVSASGPNACEAGFAEIAKESARLAWIRKYLKTFDGINEMDNQAFNIIAKLANLGHRVKPKLFVDLENAVLKSLNDKVIKDKDLVTYLTNLHKDVVWNLLQKDEFLMKAMNLKYSDFKSLRFAFDQDNPFIRQRLKAVLEEASRRYNEFLVKEMEKHGWKDLAHGLELHPGTWYHGGMGKTPDQAGVTARISRKLVESGKIKIRGFEEVMPYVEEIFAAMKESREYIARRFVGVDGFLVDSAKGNKVLSAEAIETIRKVEPVAEGYMAFKDAVISALELRFKTKISEEDFKALHLYLSKADGVAPGIYADKREVIDFSRAQFGVVSADFKGQNARNIEETLKALADSEGQTIASRIQEIRKGEKIATESLNRKKAKFCEVIKKVFKEKEYCGQFSGDDGIYFPRGLVSEKRKKLFQREWLAISNPEDIRLTFNPPEFAGASTRIPADNLSQYVGKAEDVEKKMRAYMLKNNVPRDYLNGLQIAVDFFPGADGKNAVGIYLSAKNKTINEVQARKIAQLFLQEKGLTIKFIKMI